MRYIPTIGLEIHVELKTATKMFCTSKNDSKEPQPNRNICPICVGHPGTLPTINREAILDVLRVGAAVGGMQADYTEFDRKNYFYPDLPKNYQISQYEHPLIRGGSIAGVRITRIHLEEDTARSQHDSKTGATFVDYNRAGVPLMELVTEPEIHTANAAGNFARELHTLLRYLGVSDAHMEKGEMRIEANISIAPEGSILLGTKIEVKNLNSFKSVERAIEFEIARQTSSLKSGEILLQETRGWDEGSQKTYPQRIKEISADYHYFPDPDLPKLRIRELPEFQQDYIHKSLPELPNDRSKRLTSLGISESDAKLYVRERYLGDFLDRLITLGSLDASSPKVRVAANYLSTDLVNILREIEGQDTDFQQIINVSEKHFLELVGMISDGHITSLVAKNLLKMLVSKGQSPRMLAERDGLLKKDNEAELTEMIDLIISSNRGVFNSIKSGKKSAIQFLVGQVMKVTKGTADPNAVCKLIEERLSNHEY